MCFPDKADASLFQGVATRIGGLLCLSYGLLFGITSSQILLYQSVDTPLIRLIDMEGVSWLGGYLCIGGAIGSLLGGSASRKIGPKSVLLLCGLLQIGSWFCVHFGYNINHIYSSRLVGGVAAGGAFTVLPIYIREITEDRTRRSLENTIDPIRNIGILAGFILATFAPYDYLPIIGGIVSFMFTMMFPFMPESPIYFLEKGDKSMMEKSLRWFRGIRRLEDREKPEFLDEVNQFAAQRTGKGQLTYSGIMSTGYRVRLIVISVVLVIASQFSGLFLILNYGHTIFQHVDTPIPIHWAVIALAGVQWVASVFGAFIMERINRKILLCVTSLLSGAALIILAVHMTFIGMIPLTAVQMEWFPVGLLAVHLFAANAGLYPLTYVVISEITPPKIRGTVITWTMGFQWLFALLTVKFYYVLMDLIGFGGLMWIFGGTCLFEFIFTMCFIPDTRGKSHSEISISLGGWLNA